MTVPRSLGRRLSTCDVVQTERPRPEVDLLVASAELAAERVVVAGGALLAKPRGSRVGRVAVTDPACRTL